MKKMHIFFRICPAIEECMCRDILTVLKCQNAILNCIINIYQNYSCQPNISVPFSMLFNIYFDYFHAHFGNIKKVVRYNTLATSNLIACNFVNPPYWGCSIVFQATIKSTTLCLYDVVD